MPDVYAAITEAEPAIVERGAELAVALRAEARRRAAAGEFFGHIAYASLIGLRQETKNRGTIE